jgi:hypothetical protein
MASACKLLLFTGAIIAYNDTASQDIPPRLQKNNQQCRFMALADNNFAHPATVFDCSEKTRRKSCILIVYEKTR